VQPYCKQCHLFIPFSSTIPAETFVIVSPHIIIFFGVTNSVEKQFFSRFVSPGVIQPTSTVVSRNCCVLCNWLPFIPCTVIGIMKEVTEALLFAQLSMSFIPTYSIKISPCRLRKFNVPLFRL